MKARGPKLNSPKSKTAVCIYAYLFALSVLKVFILNIFDMSKKRALVRALASHKCGPGSIAGFGVIWNLSFLVLFIALKGFSPGTRVFSLLKNLRLI